MTNNILHDRRRRARCANYRRELHALMADQAPGDGRGRCTASRLTGELPRHHAQPDSGRSITSDAAGELLRHEWAPGNVSVAVEDTGRIETRF